MVFVYFANGFKTRAVNWCSNIDDTLFGCILKQKAFSAEKLKIKCEFFASSGALFHVSAHLLENGSGSSVCASCPVHFPDLNFFRHEICGAVCINGSCCGHWRHPAGGGREHCGSPGTAS